MHRLVSKIIDHDLSILKRCVKNTNCNYKRALNLLECESKTLLQNFGVNVQSFITLDEKDNAEHVIKNINFASDKYVIKAQILAGGRGLGVFDNGYRGGVHIADKTDIERITKKMIGHRLITKQTPAAGAFVKKVMIAKCLKIRREAYFCILLDSSYNGPIIMVSPNGGTDIEEIYNTNNAAITIFPVDIVKGITCELSRDIAKSLQFDDKLYDKVSQQIINMWNLFKNIDAVQIEVNPFAVTEDDEIVAIDAKIKFDDNALFRRNDILTLHEEINEDKDEREIKANEYNLNYVGLDGNIGCLVNGAGLAMATMDIIKLYGGEPANFLDLGGGVNENQVFEAVKLLLSDKNVKSILINIFGGIVDCTIIANGIIRAMNEFDIDVPITIRFEGNNVEMAKQILAESDCDYKISFANNLHEAVQLAVSAI